MLVRGHACRAVARQTRRYSGVGVLAEALKQPGGFTDAIARPSARCSRCYLSCFGPVGSSVGPAVGATGPLSFNGRVPLADGSVPFLHHALGEVKEGGEPTRAHRTCAAWIAGAGVRCLRAGPLVLRSRIHDVYANIAFEDWCVAGGE